MSDRSWIYRAAAASVPYVIGFIIGYAASFLR